jgi:putative FmdB family regulatory protein
MPTYVYGCDACGHQFEQFQKFSDEPIRSCPRCDKNVRRIFQPAGIVFKGSGWHITDYKRSGSNGNGESKANGSGESKANGNGESKANGNGESSKAESTSAPVTSAPADAS